MSKTTKFAKNFIHDRKENPIPREKHKIKKNSDEVEMPKKEFVKEHKRLINVLESKDRKDDKREAKKQKKELKEYTKKSGYPKSSKDNKCGPGLSGKICRKNTSKLNKSEFIQNFKKSYDFKDTQVVLDAKDHQAAENADPRLIQYIRASLDESITKIPFAKGTLTLNQKDKGLYNGFFSDQDGQVVERFDNSTVEMVAKNMMVKDLYAVDVAPAHDPVDEAEDRAIAHDEAAAVMDAALNHHNRVYHQGQEPGEPINGGKGHIKLKYGNFELEIKKSLNEFVKSFRDQKSSNKHNIKKAISSWRRNYAPHLRNDYDAAKELMSNWEANSEGFNQILFAIKQLKRK